MVVSRKDYQREYMRKRRAERGRDVESDRRYRESHRKQIAAYNRAYVERTGYRYERTPEQDLRYNLARRGTTPEEYAFLLERQGGVCFFCARPEWSTKGGRLSVDHDHVTGRVRGLLCFGCNVSLGWFERGARSRLDPERAKEYLSW